MANKVIKEFQERLEMRKRLICNTEYIDWLYEFTDKHPAFTDDAWQYNRQSISDEDYNKVCMLADFYQAISDYHMKNLLKACRDECETFYIVRYKDKYFAIGVAIGQGAFNFVTVLDSVPKSYILYESIMYDLTDGEYYIKESKLNELHELLKSLKDMQVAEEVVISLVSSAFKD